MKPPVTQRDKRAAFSLVELLVVMALLSFIVLGLMMVFTQTQRAFKLGMAQVDVLEGGRAAMDLLVRDVEQMAALSRGTNDVNVFVAVQPGTTPLQQDLPGSALRRYNVLQDFFLVSQVNQNLTGIGYTVFVPADDGMGTLYRYDRSTTVRRYDQFTQGTTRGIFDYFLNNLPVQPQNTNFSRVLEGVVHFRVQAYGTNGVLLDPQYDYQVFRTVDVEYDSVNNAEFRYVFRDDALPTAVEIELGIVEEDVVARAKALPAGPIRRNYLATEAGKVHLFKQRVPIRGADPQIYQP